MNPRNYVCACFVSECIQHYVLHVNCSDLAVYAASRRILVQPHLTDMALVVVIRPQSRSWVATRFKNFKGQCAPSTSAVSTLCSVSGGCWSNTLLNRVIISLSWLVKSLDHLLQAEDRINFIPMYAFVYGKTTLTFGPVSALMIPSTWLCYSPLGYLKKETFSVDPSTRAL